MWKMREASGENDSVENEGMLVGKMREASGENDSVENEGMLVGKMRTCKTMSLITLNLDLFFCIIYFRINRSLHSMVESEF